MRDKEKFKLCYDAYYDLMPKMKAGDAFQKKLDNDLSKFVLAFVCDNNDLLRGRHSLADVLNRWKMWLDDDKLFSWFGEAEAIKTFRLTAILFT